MKDFPVESQFFYMWDDTAFYAGLRTLDTKLFNGASDDRLWEGDGVEWYFDTRQDETFRSQAWPTEPSAGAVHCYWVGLTKEKVESRFCLRPGFLEAIPKEGIEVASRKTEHGLEVEFRLPWSNFPGFEAKEDAVIALDSELCYSDGAERLFRSFVFGSPLSVQQPASLGKVQLVDRLEPEHWKACGPVMLPMRVDTAWGQKTKPMTTGIISLPPDQADEIGRVVFRLTDLDGEFLGEFQAERETFQEEGNFVRAVAHWPAGLAVPGRHQVTAVVFDKEWNELTRIAPRLVSVNWEIGY
ncbi:MAG: sugar-binding protein [Verrucomicrobiota bacterium]